MNDVAVRQPVAVCGLVRPQAHRIVPSQLKGSQGGPQQSPFQSDVRTLQTTEVKHNHVVLRSVSPAPNETEQQQPQPQLIEPHVLRPAPRLVRPVAMKVARPIPKEAVEAFYDETYRQGMNAEHVHAATVLAQDWHRKWTQQDEQGHTMPEAEADFNPNVLVQATQATKHMALSPLSQENVVYSPLDRDSGAKNPSPEDFQDDLYERKRLRLGAPNTVSSSFDSSQDSQALSPSNEPSMKRRVLGFDSNNNIMSPEFPMVQSGLMKPVALRVQRPQAIDVSMAIDILTNRQNYINDQVPANVIKELRHSQSNLSPLSLPSMSSSHRQIGPAIIEDDEENYRVTIPTEISQVSSHKSILRSPEIVAARSGVLHRLAVTGGDVDKDMQFLNHLNVLKSFYQTTNADTRFSSDSSTTSEGMWLTLTKPNYFGNLGTNDNGDPMYTMGRMSFDMFAPTRLVCSLQGNFNSVEQVSADDRAEMRHVPKSLQEEVASGDTALRTYNIITAFTVEPHLAAWPNAPNKDVRRPIRGIMTTEGYTLPDPENPNRHSVWITGGRIESNDDPVDQREWNRQFTKNPPKHGLGEQAKLLAVKLLMGATIPTHMEEDGSLQYTFERPIGGHGLAYVDTLYVDESLRIVQGHRGTIFVFSKLSQDKLSRN